RDASPARRGHGGPGRARRRGNLHISRIRTRRGGVGTGLWRNRADVRPHAACPARRLTRDYLVTYSRLVTDDDLVFKALADPSRRFLLDALFVQDGRSLTDLESGLDMTRFGVMKHLRILEDAGLVVTRRSGREKLHFLNPVPIRLIHDRWIDKYTERHVSALADLKTTFEEAQ